VCGAYGDDFLEAVMWGRKGLPGCPADAATARAVLKSQLQPELSWQCSVAVCWGLVLRGFHQQHTPF
jgi:hypothetical protein